MVSIHGAMTDSMFSAHFWYRHPCFGLFQNSHDLAVITELNLSRIPANPYQTIQSHPLLVCSAHPWVA